MIYLAGILPSTDMPVKMSELLENAEKQLLREEKLVDLDIYPLMELR